ncbi:MAG: cardiolipin synthase [Lachnospiraceae bacterium]|nr:cardiolipin synthase [Lachnospiraceae bacterium]
MKGRETMEDVLSLTKPRKGGLLRLIFSRFFIIVVLLILQILIVISFYAWLRDLLPFFSVLLVLFTLGGVIYLFSSGMDSSAKLTWMFIIAIMPITGVAMLAFTQTNVGNRALRRRVAELIAGTSDAIKQQEGILEKFSRDGSGTDDLAAYLNRSGCFPVFHRTQATYFPLGEDMFTAMMEELKKAEKFIFMEYFIIGEGYMWGSILKVLAEKAKAGVEVRVMYDGMLEVSTLPANYCSLLKEHGIQAKPFSPIRPVISSHYNYRDHRKILVIDGKVAFTGGINLSDEYINRVERFGHWKDTAVMLKGDAARSFTLMFLQMWNITEEKPVYNPWLGMNKYDVPAYSSGYVIPYGDCPLDGDKVGEMVYIDILNRANDYVHIMTPYLILDGELEAAITFAAQRGVDVKLILPGIPDKKLAYALAKAHYKRLTEAGVKIYEYTPGFVHAKVFVSDSRKAVVGTINLDYRSLYHHFECAAYMYETDCIPDIEKDFQATLSKCRKVTPESIKNEKLFYKVMGSLMQFIAPMM